MFCNKLENEICCLEVHQKQVFFLFPPRNNVFEQKLFNSSFKFMMLANPGYASLLPRFTLPEGKIVRGQNCPILRNS